jgi:hypothetical protein
MIPIPITLQLIEPNCEPIHALAYTVPRSVEQQLQQSKEIVRLVDIEVLEEIPKKNGTIRVITDLRKLNLLLKHSMSLISYSKDWGHDPFHGFTFDSALYLNMGYYHIKLDADAQKLCTILSQ